MFDIVYILKEDVTAEELRYSLRSLKNFPYRKVWFYGGKPDGIKPDEWVPYRQKGIMPWEKVISTIYEISRNKDITEDFWLFNDDFYIMRPVTEPFVYYDRTLFRRIQQIEKSRGGARSLYTQQLRRTRDALQDSGCKTFNYEEHMPMLINRKKAKELIEANPKMVMFRSTYGNVYEIGGENHPDVKIINPVVEPKEDCDFLSTSDGNMSETAVGRFIQARFQDKCKYEI